MAKGSNWANTAALILAGVSGFFLIAEHYIDIEIVNWFGDELLIWVTILSAYFLLYGFATTTLRNIKILSRETTTLANRALSVWFLLLLWGMTIVGLAWGMDHYIFTFFWDTWYMSLRQAIQSLPAFYVFSAAYKSFRMKNIESSIFLLSGTAILLLNAPVTVAMWPSVKTIGEWVMNVPMAAGLRAFTIAAGIGICGYSIRVLLGGQIR